MKRGFTLIELLIVVAILATLASIVLIGLSQFRGRGNDAKRVADLRQVQSGLELYYTKYGNYPIRTQWSDMSADLIGAVLGITTIPQDPTKPDNYQYVSIDGQSYTLQTTLDDKDNPVLKDAPTGPPPGEQWGVGCDHSLGQYCIHF